MPRVHMYPRDIMNSANHDSNIIKGGGSDWCREDSFSWNAKNYENRSLSHFRDQERRWAKNSSPHEGLRAGSAMIDVCKKKTRAIMRATKSSSWILRFFEPIQDFIIIKLHLHRIQATTWIIENVMAWRHKIRVQMDISHWLPRFLLR